MRGIMRGMVSERLSRPAVGVCMVLVAISASPRVSISRANDAGTDSAGSYMDPQRGVTVEDLAAVRNLEAADQLLELNRQNYKITEARVREGEAAPLEQGLFQVELARIESDRLLFDNQVARGLLELRTLAGMGLDEPLALR